MDGIILRPEDDLEEDMEEDSALEEGQTVSDVQSVPELVSFVQGRYRRAKNARRPDEDRWIKAYRNYRGNAYPEQVDGDQMMTDTEDSNIFVKITKTKVNAVYGKLIKIMFGQGKFPLSIDPTIVPDGIKSVVHVDPQGAPAPRGPTPEDGPLPPGATQYSLGALSKKLDPVKDKLVDGYGSGENSITFHPAQATSKRMEMEIHDQLNEGNVDKKCRSMAFECALYGTGILKGPEVVRKETPKWDKDGKYSPQVRNLPTVEFVSVWNYYPDPDAVAGDRTYDVERLRTTVDDLVSWKKNDTFDAEAIDRALDNGYNYEPEWWENIIEDNSVSEGPVERFETLVFWGDCLAREVRASGVSLDRDIHDMQLVNMNVWVCNNEVIRCVTNPYVPVQSPYYVVPYEHNPYSVFGIGVAENMDDTQTMMNGFMRMAIDNGVMSGSLVFEVNDQYLKPGQDLKVHPKKIFLTEGPPGQSIFAHQFPNVSAQNIQMFELARRLADESTGIPSYSHGQTGVQGLGRTASGISMLMGAAGENLEVVAKNFDDYLITPLGKAFYYYNMENSDKDDIKGDYQVRARGLENFMAGEVRSQRLMQFLQIGLNPLSAPFLKVDAILRDIAKELQLDPDKTVNNLDDAKLAAMIMGELSNKLPGNNQQGNAAGAPKVDDPSGSGGGNIGTAGAPPGPGQLGFSASGGGDG